MTGDRDNPDLRVMAQNATGAALLRFQCSFPAVCTSAEGPDNRVTVQPAIRIPAKNGQQSDAKPVTIPVAWPSWGPYVVQGTLAVGDEVLVRCQDKNWLAWLLAGGIIDDLGIGGHQAGYAVAEPAQLSAPRRPSPLPPTVAIRIGRKDSLTTVELNTDGSIKLAATDVTLTSGSGLGAFLAALHAGITAWIVVPNDGAAALKAALGVWLGLTPPTGGPPPP